MNPKRLVLLLAAAGLAFSARGADLLGVYRDALVSDPVFQSARAQYQSGLEALPIARAGYLPSVSGTASAFRNQVDTSASARTDYNTQSYAVTLSQPVFRWQNWIAISQAEQQVLQTEATFASAKQDLIVRVAQAYFDVLLAQDNVAVSEAQKKAISEQLAQAKRNFEVGTSTIVDTLEAQARYDQAVAKDISDKNDLEVKKRALQQLLGKPSDGLAPLKEALELPTPKPANIEDWVSAASTSSFSVAVSRAALEIAGQEVERAKAGHYPTVDLSASYTHSRAPTLSLGTSEITTNSGALGLQLSVPLFAGGATQSRVRQALAGRDRAGQDLENTQRTVAQSVRQSYLNVTSGIAQVKALEQALASTQSQLDSTILGRDVGVRTSVDVLNAQQQVFQTRRDLLQARYAYILNTLRLKAATGTLDEPDLEQVNRALGRG
ncbi:MAG TPA: TolC family outer membrane protein [Usitatibacteraceae bacterium]|nr:TolC family outer membrane protein [Usitatibacteraceae bacterium]